MDAAAFIKQMPDLMAALQNSTAKDRVCVYIGAASVTFCSVC